MIIDRRQSAELPDTAYDVVIIGGGPAGITLARELGESGLRIALLESGGEDYDDDAQALNEGRIEGNESYELIGSRLRFLGGTSNHWGGQCTPFDPIDFERAPSGFSGWPMTHADMVPYWQRAHDYCDVGNYRYDAKELGPADPDLWLLNDAPEIETVILRQSTPTRFGEKYRTWLAESETVHLWLWTTAVTVSTRQDTTGETVLTRDFDGSERVFSGRAVVLAAGAIEATRLLLWSNVQNGTRAGTSGDLLGRCYMDHIGGGAGFLYFDEPVGDMVQWVDIDTYSDDGIDLHFGLHLKEEVLRAKGLNNAIFHALPLATDLATRRRQSGANRALSSLKDLVKWTIGRKMNLRFDPGEAYCTMTLNADEFVADRTDRLINGSGVTEALLRFEAEELPRRTNSVTLAPEARDALGVPLPVLVWKPSEDDLASVRESALLIGQAAGATGLGRFEFEDHGDDPYWGTGTAWHQLGCMRMAQSPTSGVTDPDCRVHGAGALYVASGAVFPSGGRANPTLTIVALAVRLGDHLKERLRA